MSYSTRNENGRFNRGLKETGQLKAAGMTFSLPFIARIGHYKAPLHLFAAAALLGAPAAADMVTSYQYDEQGRLSAASVSGAETTSYSFDLAQNILLATVTGTISPLPADVGWVFPSPTGSGYSMLPMLPTCSAVSGCVEK